MIIKKRENDEAIRIDKLQMGEGYFLSRPRIVLNDCPVTFHYETIEAGCSIGRHFHNEETEYYYILSGKGAYDDNGRKTTLEAGDVAVCGGGEYHSIVNEGEEPIVFMGIISGH